MERTLDLATFTKRLMEETMGYYLDFARGSDMGDRQFNQFERSVKSYTRKAIHNNVMLLSEYNKFNVDLTVLQRVEEKKPEELKK